MLHLCKRLEKRGATLAQELGVSILTDLHRQRQTITHSRDTLHGADDNIARARKVPGHASLSRCASAVCLATCSWHMTASAGVCLLSSICMRHSGWTRRHICMLPGGMSACYLLSRPEQQH